MTVQARILPALAALHNFILQHDPTDLNDYIDVGFDPNPGWYTEHDLGVLSEGRTTRAEKRRADERRDRIAMDMWIDYQAVLEERGML
jgi:hypothetical protein